MFRRTLFMDIEETKEEGLGGGIIEQVNIDQEMRSAYIDYSMSVIVSRALPDARDGLKPVQRRVLFGMDGLGIGYSGQTKKSARIVGDCSVSSTLMATQAYMMQWPGLPRTGTRDILWYTVRVTSVRWTATLSLPCDTPRPSLKR